MDQFRTGWFLASVITELLILLVIRTQKPFFRSKLSKYLLIATLMVVGVTLILPYCPISVLLGFTSIPLLFLLALGVITALYIATAEMVKKIFYKRVHL